LTQSAETYQRERVRVGKVPISTKFFQAVGALPEAFKGFAFGTFVLFFYNQVLGVNAFTAAAVLGSALIIDSAIDPLIGSFSDSLKTRLGRRHLLMYLSAAPLGIGLYLVFSPPHGLGETALLVWMFATVVLTHISTSVFVVPWTALFAEFSDDYVERTTIVTWRSAVGLFGGLAFSLFTWRYLFAKTAAYPQGQLNPHSYTLFAPFVAVATVAAVLITTQLTRREIPYLLQPVKATPRFSLVRVWRDIASTFVNRNFLILFIGALLTAGVSGTTDTLGIYMWTYFWGLAGEQLQWFSLAVFGAVGAFASLGYLGRVFDKKTVLLWTFMLLLIDGMGVVVLRLLHLMPPNGSTLLLVVLVANETVRAYLGILLSIIFVSMLADTIDQQELNTGRRQEGIFAAALAFSGKATAGVGAVIAGFLLTQIVHWPTHVDPHTLSAAAVTRLGLVAGVLVPALLIFPFMLGVRYRLTRAAHAEVHAELERRRAITGATPPDEGVFEVEAHVVAPGTEPLV